MNAFLQDASMSIEDTERLFELWSPSILDNAAFGFVNALSSKEQTALHLAAKNGNVHTLLLLLNLGCDKNIVDGSGQTALDIARKSNQHQCINILQDANWEDTHGKAKAEDPVSIRKNKLTRLAQRINSNSVKYDSDHVPESDTTSSRSSLDESSSDQQRLTKICLPDEQNGNDKLNNCLVDNKNTKKKLIEFEKETSIFVTVKDPLDNFQHLESLEDNLKPNHEYSRNAIEKQSMFIKHDCAELKQHRIECAEDNDCICSKQESDEAKLLTCVSDITPSLLGRGCKKILHASNCFSCSDGQINNHITKTPSGLYHSASLACIKRLPALHSNWVPPTAVWHFNKVFSERLQRVNERKLEQIDQNK